MPARNTQTSYGSVAKSFHWLTALLILSLIPLGIIANDLPFDTGEALARKAFLFSMHKTLGVTLFFVALARIAWALGQPKPAGLHPERRAESFLAELVHWLLYGSLIVVPLSGWVHHASTSGFAPIWWPFGQDLPFVPKNQTLADVTAGLHIVFERVLVVSIALHIVGALKHHVIDKDDTLRRMLPGHTAAGTPRSHSTLAPLGAALAVWSVALGIGAGLGAYSPHGEARPGTQLAQVQSDWTVETGSLAITVTQFGSQVQGQFEDWTADITFLPTTQTLTHGSVTTIIAIDSLTLGSVTEQALGPDFFDATAHPTAKFEADLIYQADESYIADGTLSIRGTTVPVQMPFDLDLVGDTAKMSARILLDRRDFGIGDNMPDEDSLRFSVNVDIALTATRGPDQGD